jgi:hypothetical protein
MGCSHPFFQSLQEGERGGHNNKLREEASLMILLHIYNTKSSLKFQSPIQIARYEYDRVAQWFEEPLLGIIILVLDGSDKRVTDYDLIIS